MVSEVYVLILQSLSTINTGLQRHARKVCVVYVGINDQRTEDDVPCCLSANSVCFHVHYRPNS